MTVPAKFIKRHIRALGLTYKWYHERLKREPVPLHHPMHYLPRCYADNMYEYTHKYLDECAEAGRIYQFDCTSDSWVAANHGKGVCWFCSHMIIRGVECWKVFDGKKLVYDKGYIKIRMKIIKSDIRILKGML